MWKKLTILIICLHLCLSMRLHLTAEFSEEAKDLAAKIIGLYDEEEIDIMAEAIKHSNKLTQEEKDEAHKCAEIDDTAEKSNCILEYLDEERKKASSGDYTPTEA